MLENKFYFSFSIACVMLLFGSTATSSSYQIPNLPEDIEISIDTNLVLINDFKGFGAEWDPYFWADYNRSEGVNEDDWKNDIQRIRWMRLSFVRMMIQLSWVAKNDSIFDWNAPQMQNMYRQLDVCQSAEITVFLTDWGLNTTWNKVPEIRGDNDPKYADAIGTYLKYLIKTRGYTCIKYFIFINEPNRFPGQWQVWKNGLMNVANVIKKENIPVQLVGSDESGDISWQVDATKQMYSSFDAWEIHTYFWQSMIVSGAYQDTLTKYWNLVKSDDPTCEKKFFMIGEMSPSDGMRGSSVNDSAGTFGYGVNIADMGVQAVLSGTSAVSAWMLEDAEHKGFNMGMWKDKAGGFQFRPWFYSWSLLSRNFPPGSRIFKPKVKHDKFRYLVAKTSDGGWSICLINRKNTVDSVEVSTDFIREPMQFDSYIYSYEPLSVDSSGFLIPARKVIIRPTQNYSIIVPPNSVVVLTTLK